MTLRGLSWGHRRATGPTDAIARAARERLSIEVEWEVQSLAGFEHGLGDALADRYDLIVFDHPFCGSVAACRLMHPLDTVLADLRDEDFVGRSLDSYRYAGHLWALPVDGATQCAVYRPDLIQGDGLPTDWDAVVRLGERLRREGRWLGLATLAPHGVLVLLALCANLDRPLAADPLATPFDRAVLRHAARLLRAVADLSRPDGRAMNAIDLHDAMVRDDDVVYCPAAYAYLTYAETDQRRPLRFAGFPGPDGRLRGTVLGGTGLGIARGCRDVAAASAVVRMVASADAQLDLVMRHHGQPGRAEAWSGADADRLFGGAHAAIRHTMEAAWTRPRFAGFIPWQATAGATVEAFLRRDLDVEGLVRLLADRWSGG
ncbi:MAG: hypothetical protein ACK5YI_23420 [Rhodospirillales bacterium]